MMGERDIFCAALERPAGSGRTTFLDAACDGSAAARARVEALLRAAEAAGDFLADAAPAAAEGPGTRLDRYRLGERIGEGGFGVVYRAVQERPVRREVALKIIKLGMDTRAVVARFEAERQALARMEHPHIARVLDAGATDTGRPYFVMELVRGVPITAFCREQRLRVRERIDVFLQVCRAVHHAHQKGIIHRDLKPSNILVALVEERPVAKVIDFGIAKATCEPLTAGGPLTRQPMFLGTPAYMSPEQLAPGDRDVDTRSDLYSLGALLYELLADTPVVEAAALAAAGPAAVERAICAVEPPPPSLRVAALAPAARLAAAERRRCAPARLVAELRGELDWIVLKCLEQDRERRYQTAEELARDLTRFLRHEPVQARRPTLAYRAGKFVRRHRGGVTAAAAALAAVAGIGVYHTQRLAAERDLARAEARKAARVSDLLTEILIAGDPFRTPTPHGVLEASAARVRQEFAAQPAVRAEILNAVGRVHLRRGEHAKALPVLTEALAAGRESGRPGLGLAQTLSDLGVLRRETGDSRGALPLLAEALAVRRRLRGREHNDVAISLVELGRAHSALERLDLAEPLFREALDIRRRVLGEEHREVAVSLGDLAAVLWQRGDLAAAEPIFAASLALHRRTLGPDHPNVGQSLANLAQLRVDQHRLGEAEALLREALPIFHRSFGERHWRTARVLGQLAGVQRQLRQFDAAAAVLADALPLARAELGPDRPQVAALAVERAQLHLDCGEPAAAEPLLREALRIQRLTCPDPGWRIAATQGLLGAALMELGRCAEAEPLLIAAVAHLPAIPGPLGRETMAARARLAALQQSQVAVRR